MALDTTLDWQSLLNFGGVWPRVLSDPEANDIDQQGEQNVLLGLSGDITPADATSDTGETQDDIVFGYARAFIYARAYAKAHARSKR